MTRAFTYTPFGNSFHWIGTFKTVTTLAQHILDVVSAHGHNNLAMAAAAPSFSLCVRLVAWKKTDAAILHDWTLTLWPVAKFKQHFWYSFYFVRCCAAVAPNFILFSSCSFFLLSCWSLWLLFAKISSFHWHKRRWKEKIFFSQSRPKKYWKNRVKNLYIMSTVEFNNECCSFWPQCEKFHIKIMHIRHKLFAFFWLLQKCAWIFTRILLFFCLVWFGFILVNGKTFAKNR